jgi:hypothetical protein
LTGINDLEPVWKAIADTENDLKHAANCCVLEEDTAAVFHLMRGVEWGLRAFCYHLGFKNVKSTKKSGQIVFTPIEYATWETVLSAVTYDRIADAGKWWV